MTSSNDSKRPLILPGSGPFSQLILLVFVFSFQIQQSRGQSVSVTIASPDSGAIANENLAVTVQVTSTFQLQACQAFVEDRTNQLVFAAPYWTGTLSLAGLARGNKVLTVVATDVFGNSNQDQRSFVYDLRPKLIVTGPPNGAVARSSLQVTASATDDGPTPPIIQVLNGNNELARGTNSLNANVVLPDGQLVTLTFRATDSLGQATNITRQVYVQLSSNLVEVARVSDGEIRDVEGDRILFVSNDGSTNRLMTKSLSNGTENVLYQTDSVGTALLTPSGVAFEAPIYDDNLTRVYEDRNGSLIQRGPIADHSLVRKGNFLSWGKGFLIYLGDLLTTNTTTITNLGEYHNFVHSDGTILLTGGIQSHSIHRYHAGVFSVLASDPNTIFESPQTDGSHVCCVIFPPNNGMLVFLTNGATATIADGSFAYQMNNGWIAYTRNTGTGQYQVWRRSPDGATVQLTFYGSSSALGALAPNGEVAFYNNSHLYISKGSWPPVDAGLTPSDYQGPFLKPLWQNGRWYATLGGSLFQIYTGNPEIISPQITANTFRFDVLGAIGQHLVSQSSTDLLHWTDLATNSIADGASMSVTDTGLFGLSAKYYRLRLQ